MSQTVENTEVHMSQKKWFKVSRALFGVLLLVTVVAFTGCESAPAVEAQTPTGCWKKEGRYYDPKTKECVQVTDRQTVFILNAYRYVNELAEEGKLPEAEYVIHPKRYLTIEEAEVLWSELRAQGATMVNMGGDLPANREYDPGPGPESWGLKKYLGTPKVWGEGVVEAGCGWMKREDAPAETIEGMLDEGLKTLEQERPRPQMRQAVMVDRDCLISLMVVIVDPKVMRDWWNRHLDDIEQIQPRVNDLDGLMPVFGPAVLKEGA
jgi:hypothetical protein